MTVECKRCGYLGGFSEVMGGVPWMIQRAIPGLVIAHVLLFIARCIKPLLIAEMRFLPLLLFVMAMLWLLRCVIPGRLTQLYFFLRGCPECGGHRWERPHFFGFGL